MKRLVLACGLAALVVGCNYDNGTPNYDDSIPDNSYCRPVSDWDPEWLDWENEIITLLNEERAQGASCGGEPYGSAPALQASPELRCASRVHSKDMHDRQFFDHTNPDGDGPSDRFGYAGWSGSGWGENIIAGYGSPEAMVAGWMESPGHCRNIMNPSFTHIGLGYFFGPNGYGHYATTGFGRQ